MPFKEACFTSAHDTKNIQVRIANSDGRMAGATADQAMK